MCEPEECDVCGEVLRVKNHATWIGPDSARVEMPIFDKRHVIVSGVDGDLCICEQCYLSSASSKFSGIDLHELHHEFGLEYLDLEYDGEKDTVRAAECFRRAISVKRTPEALCSLATSVTSRSETIRLLKEALEIDPECELAKWNLENLQLKDLKKDDDD